MLFKCKKEGPFLFKLIQSKESIYRKIFYEKEMLAIIHALKPWSPYLMGIHLKVKKKIMIVLNNFWNKDYLQKISKNGSQRCWVMTLKSSTKKGSKMLLQMHSQERMSIWRHFFVPFLLSNLIGKEVRDEWKNNEEFWTLIKMLQQDSRAFDTFI